MVLGWPIGATLGTRLVMRFGVRPVMLVAGALIPGRRGLFAVLGPSTPIVLAGIGSSIFGLGMGLLSSRLAGDDPGDRRIGPSAAA